MEHNPTFARLPDERALGILGLIETVLVPYWWDHGLIDEEMFDEVFSE